MAPVAPTIPLSGLESAVNTLPSGKPRRPPIALVSCPLKQLVQYKCNLTPPDRRRQRSVDCVPVVRLIRQCVEGVNAETTAWEVWRAQQEGDEAKL